MHALAPSARNLTDEQLDAIGTTGGLVGIVFHVGLVRGDGAENVDTPLSTLVDHVRYVAERIGVEHVALGSDFDGATMPAELRDAAGLPRLVDALRDARRVTLRRRRDLPGELAARPRGELHRVTRTACPGGLAPARCRSSLDRRCTTCPRTDVSAWAADTPDRRDWPPATRAGALPRLSDSKAALGRVDDPPEAGSVTRLADRVHGLRGGKVHRAAIGRRVAGEAGKCYVDPSGRSGWKPPLDARSRGPECPPYALGPGVS